jgi:hypothetical protein
MYKLSHFTLNFGQFIEDQRVPDLGFYFLSSTEFMLFLFFYLFMVLGFEFRVFTLSHSTSQRHVTDTWLVF